MRVLMALLLLGCVVCIFSAITGVQAFEASSRTGTLITYWQGSWRWLAVVYGAIFAVAFYGIYRRFPIAWKLGWVLLIASAVDFIVESWLALIHEPDGWFFAVVATLLVIGVALYWGVWWRKQKHYFTPNATEKT